MTFSAGNRSTPDGAFVFRPQTGVAACLVWAVIAAGVLFLAGRSGWSSVLEAILPVGLVTTVVYAVFGRPRVVVRDDGVLLRNVIRDVDMSFSALARIETQYALTLITVDGRHFQSWAAPATGRFGAARVTEEERKALTWSGPVDEIPASAGLRSDAGAAAVAIRRRWRPDGTSVADRSAARVDTRWATWVLIAAGLFAIGTLLVALR